MGQDMPSTSTLAVQLEALQREVDVLVAKQRSIELVVKQLAAGARDRAAGPTGGADGPAPPETDGVELLLWVRWLVERYELDEVPPCWHLHGGLVEELDALRRSWLAAVASPTRGSEPVVWHNYMAQVMERFGRRARPCINGDHRDWTWQDWAKLPAEQLDVPDLADRWPAT